MQRIILALLFLFLIEAPLTAEKRVEKNVIYGMYSGLALLMDVHHPERSNGYGLVLIPGSGWNSAQAYNARSIKDRDSMLFVFWAPLLEAGYTLFVINHRAAPRFRYPAAVEDAQRAVRFIRFHAGNYGIQADRIGAAGYSSGGHLVALLGTLNGAGNAEDLDPVNRVSASIQAVVACAAPTDLTRFDSGFGVPFLVSFLGQLPAFSTGAPRSPEARAYRAASPVAHLSADSAPLLLVHGDADEVVPFHQAELMVDAAREAGAEVKLIRMPGGTHDFAGKLSEHPEWPDPLAESVDWFNRHLKDPGGR